ncbi:MAG: hypothetical protein ACJAVK_001314 [Akkermansiaceae bacterium]|jgi:hypothetical protein
MKRRKSTRARAISVFRATVHAGDDSERSFDHSSDLETWQPAGDDLTFLGTTDNGDGIARLGFSSTEGFAARSGARARQR